LELGGGKPETGKFAPEGRGGIFLGGGKKGMLKKPVEKAGTRPVTKTKPQKETQKFQQKMLRGEKESSI